MEAPVSQQEHHILYVECVKTENIQHKGNIIEGVDQTVKQESCRSKRNFRVTYVFMLQ